MYKDVTEKDIGKWIEVTNHDSWEPMILSYILEDKYCKRFVAHTGMSIGDKYEPRLYTYARVEDKDKRFEQTHASSGIKVESIVQVVRYQDLNIVDQPNLVAKAHYEQYGLVVGEKLAGEKSVFQVLFERNCKPVDIPYYCLEEQYEFTVSKYGKPGQTVYRQTTANLNKTYEILTIFKCDGNEYVVVSPNFERDDAKPFIVDEAALFLILSPSDLDKE